MKAKSIEIFGHTGLLAKLFAKFTNDYVCESCGGLLQSERTGYNTRSFYCPNGCATDAVSSLLENNYKVIGSSTIKYYSEEELQSFSKPVAIINDGEEA